MSSEAFWYVVRALVMGATLGVPVGYLVAWLIRVLQ